jgi:hypothetical protein
MSLQKKNKIYYIFFRDLRGRMNSRSLKTSNLKEAEELHEAFMENLRISRQKAVILRNFPLTNAITTAPDTFAEQLQNTAQNRLKLKNMAKCAEKKKDISVTAYKYWNRFIDTMQKSKYRYADEITPAIALKYLESYYNKGNGKTYNNAKCYLNGIFKYCLIEANITQSPFDLIPNRRIDKSKVNTHRNLTDAEIKNVMPELDKDIQVLTMLSRWTTQRLETCSRMTPAMFDFDKKVFIIKPSKTARFNKYVCCPIMPELEEFIKPILKHCKQDNLPIAYQVRNCTDRTNEAISKAFLTALKRCNITDTDEGKASFHSLRGSAITYFKELGISSDDLRLMTGHSTDNMESIYDRSAMQISAIAHRAAVPTYANQNANHE